VFKQYESFTPKQRYEALKDRDFCLLRYRYLIQNLEGDRVQQIWNFTGYLENETNFLQAPASSKKRFHLSEPGGLLRHSVWVSDQYISLLKFFGVEMAPTSARLVSLFHDISKSGLGGVVEGDPHFPRYVETNQEEWRKTGEEYRYNPEMPHLFLPVGSLWLVSSFVPLTIKEAQCIVAHDGQYCLENRSYAHRLCPEASILCMADESSLLYERELV
jgi:hypothetical protein